MMAQRITNGAAGYTLIELVITLTVLAVLTLGAVPLVQNSVRRQKEQRLRETLREIRTAIDEFRRDALSGPCGATQGGQPVSVNPRSRVGISDCKIFEASKNNPDRYPPTLEILVEGVEVKPLAQAGGPVTSGSGINSNSTIAFGDPNGATGNNATEPKKKFYLREMPIDPITGKAEWQFRSSYQEVDNESWDEDNVFDVRSKAEGKSLNNEDYKDF